MNEQTRLLVGLAPAIARIDGGCRTCIKCFLADSYLLKPFDLIDVVVSVNRYLNTPQLSVQELNDQITRNLNNQETLI
jgi:hypothetical protein